MGVVTLRTRLDEAWSAYLDARAVAEETGSIEAGIAAGRAWRRWLDQFMSADQRQWLDRARVG